MKKEDIKDKLANIFNGLEHLQCGHDEDSNSHALELANDVKEIIEHLQQETLKGKCDGCKRAEFSNSVYTCSCGVDTPKESNSVEGLSIVFDKIKNAQKVINKQNSDDMAWNSVQGWVQSIKRELTEYANQSLSTDFQKELDKAYQQGFTDGNQRDRTI